MAGEYSDLKMPWYYAREGRLPDAPKQAQVILSDLCNQDCVLADGTPWCAYRMSGYTSNEMFTKDAELSKFGHNNPKRFIPSDRAIRLLSEMKRSGVKAIQFTGGGEPTVHPDHFAIFDHALDLGFECALVSNGLKWSPALIELLTRFAWVRVSIDAGTAETYSAFRSTPIENFHKVWQHVYSLSEAIDDAGTNTVLGVGFVVTPDNHKELKKAVAMAKQHGAHNIRLSCFFNTEGVKPFQHTHQFIRQEAKEAKDRYEEEGFTVHNNVGERLSDLELGNPDYDVCAKMHYCTYVGADLQVYVCCVYAYNHYGAIPGGNLKNRAFDEFWASEDRKGFMRRFNPRACERCQFNGANRAMNYMLSADPTHKAFP